MIDPRYQKLADVLIGHSIGLASGERILLDLQDTPDAMGIALIRAVTRRGGLPLLQLNHSTLSREMALNSSEKQLTLACEMELYRIRKMDAYVAIRGSHNITEMSDVPPERMKLIARKMRPAMNHRVNNTRWVVLRWPTSAMAQQAGMSTAGFEDYFFRVCTLDYSRMRPGMSALKELMEKTDRVEIMGPGTDLRFSIKGIPAIPCGGSHNIPDGEVFTAPVKNSVEGYVTFNTPTIYQGAAFDRIRLEFRGGRIVAATANNTKRLNQILDSDPGARFIGEFSLGFNPHILEPMRDILFDEKIAGSFHFTPGQAYEVADNGNRSQVHWDMVCIQRKDYGGGEIRFDGKVIRKDGEFVIPALEKLNRKYLLAEGLDDARKKTGRQRRAHSS